MVVLKSEPPRRERLQLGFGLREKQDRPKPTARGWRPSGVLKKQRGARGIGGGALDIMHGGERGLPYETVSE